MNIQGHLVEQRRRKVLMPYWRGIFSIGAVSGALCGSLAASIGLPLGWQLPGVSMVLLVAMWLATTRHLPDGILQSSSNAESLQDPSDGPQALAWSGSITGVQEQLLSFEAIVILLGIMTFATALGEGAANDWLALVLVDNRGAAPGIGALA